MPEDDGMPGISHVLVMRLFIYIEVIVLALDITAQDLISCCSSLSYRSK